MSRRRGKDVGKIVRVRKKRVGLKLPSSKVLTVVIALALVVLVSLYAYTSLGSGRVTQELSPHDVLKLLTSAGNTSVVLIYDVSGDLPLGNSTVLNIYDKITLLVQSYVVGLNETADSSNVSRKYLINFYDINPSHLTYYLLLKLGIPSVTEDLKNLFADASILDLIYANVTSAYVGRELLKNKVLGIVEVNVYEVVYDSTMVRTYYDVIYNIPVEVVIMFNYTYEVRLTLSNVFKL